MTFPFAAALPFFAAIVQATPAISLDSVLARDRPSGEKTSPETSVPDNGVIDSARRGSTFK